jgi:hypothetical protein
VRRLPILLAAGLVLSACGATPRAATGPRVHVKIATPNNGGTTFDDHVAITGTVTPADAAVRVMGEDADVTGDGTFEADVQLAPGGNVIDVTATAPGHRPATDAVRFNRDTRILVPNVVDASPEDAVRTLESAELKAAVRESGSWLDRLLGDPHVCATDPPAGRRVYKGSTVTVETARDCG